MTHPTHLQADTGLCQYESPDAWFDKTRIRTNLAICTNCPVRQACGQSALDMDVTDGIWAGVRLPGVRFPAALDAARQEIARVVTRLDHAPAEHQRHTLRVREAIHHAAVAPEQRRLAARDRRITEVTAAVERMERLGV